MTFTAGDKVVAIQTRTGPVLVRAGTLADGNKAISLQTRTGPVLVKLGPLTAGKKVIAVPTTTGPVLIGLVTTAKKTLVRNLAYNIVATGNQCTYWMPFWQSFTSNFSAYCEDTDKTFTAGLVRYPPVPVSGDAWSFNDPCVPLILGSNRYLYFDCAYTGGNFSTDLIQWQFQNNGGKLQIQVTVLDSRNHYGTHTHEFFYKETSLGKTRATPHLAHTTTTLDV